MTPDEGVLHAGPAGSGELAEQLRQAVETMSGWMAGYGDFAPHPSLDVPLDQLRQATGALQMRLRENYPFFHPRYVGQMLKPPHPAAVIGYVSAMLVNPNNHALDGGPATARMEKEVVAQLAAMFGFPEHLGHLTSSGTIANLEALFIARELHPGKAVAHSADAHYTHGRMCHLLGVEAMAVPAAADGTMDLQALEEALRGGHVGTVVATAGTTGLGAVDAVHDIVALCRRYGARVHVDAAYGGFFRLIADDTDDGVAAAPFAAIATCDSVVIDPHKHGLQPYGCGAVLFRDPSVARHYLHDSPYTYFTSDELHLGEISLECSSLCATAAALMAHPAVAAANPMPGLGACCVQSVARLWPGPTSSTRAASSPSTSARPWTSSATSPPGGSCRKSTAPARTCSTAACACPPRSRCSSPPTPWTAPAWPPAGTRWTRTWRAGASCAAC